MRHVLTGAMQQKGRNILRHIMEKCLSKKAQILFNRVNENAMIIEFGREGIPAVAQSPIKVFYENEVVGEYFADILVDEKVIVEIKAARTLASEDEAQLLNYLKATDIEVGLLLNYGPKPEIKRKVFDNLRK